MFYLRNTKQPRWIIIIIGVGFFALGFFAFAIEAQADSHAVDGPVCANKEWRKCDAWCTAAGAWCNATNWTSYCAGDWYNIQGYQTPVECCNASDCGAGKICAGSGSSRYCADDPSDDSHAVDGPVCANKEWRKCDAWCTAAGAWCNATNWTSYCAGTWYNDTGYQIPVVCCNNSDCPSCQRCAGSDSARSCVSTPLTTCLGQWALGNNISIGGSCCGDDPNECPSYLASYDYSCGKDGKDTCHCPGGYACCTPGQCVGCWGGCYNNEGQVDPSWECWGWATDGFTMTCYLHDGVPRWSAQSCPSGQSCENHQCVEISPTYVDCGLRFYSGAAIITIACEPAGTLTSPLRIRKGATTYGIVLVPTTDANASPIRIKTNSGFKALRKY